VITMCPKCSSNKVNVVMIDDNEELQPIFHHTCERCDQEWVE
jgi:formate dehydrogenase maturation protein FdhE